MNRQKKNGKSFYWAKVGEGYAFKPNYKKLTKYALNTRVFSTYIRSYLHHSFLKISNTIINLQDMSWTYKRAVRNTFNDIFRQMKKSRIETLSWPSSWIMLLFVRKEKFNIVKRVQEDFLVFLTLLVSILVNNSIDEDKQKLIGWTYNGPMVQKLLL